MIAVEGLRAVGRTGLVLGPLSLSLGAGTGADRRVDDAGASLAVTGPHGGGKSLLLSCLARLAPSTSTRFDVPPHGRTAMIFQRDALDDARTALENVAVAAPFDPFDPFEAARRALQQVGLDGHEHTRPRLLSGGMRKRVGIARAIVAAPALVLADEPTAGLDPHTASRVLDVLLDAARLNGAALIIATTDVDVVLPRVQRAVFLAHGQLSTTLPSAYAPRHLAAASWLTP